jgi:hypothetical protein
VLLARCAWLRRCLRRRRRRRAARLAVAVAFGRPGVTGGGWSRADGTRRGGGVASQSHSPSVPRGGQAGQGGMPFRASTPPQQQPRHSSHAATTIHPSSTTTSPEPDQAS